MGERVLPVLSLMSWLCLFVAVALATWVALASTLLGWEPVVVSSGSMAPAFRTGDVVLLAEPDEGSLEEGTIISFDRRPGESVTHRVHRARRDGTYETKGDANRSPDRRTVAHGHVTGVGQLLVPAIGLPLLWVDEGRVALLLLLAVVTAGAGWMAFTPLAQGPARRREIVPTGVPPAAGRWRRRLW